MKRNISAAEKAVITFFILAAILGGGGYLFVYPAYNSIGSLEKQIEQKNTEIDNADKLIDEGNKIDGVYEKKLERAAIAHECFYNEMTSIEAVRLTQQLLKDAGHTPLSGITVSNLSESKLTIELFRPSSRINYELRQYSFLLDNMVENAQTGENTGEEWNYADEIMNLIYKNLSDEEKEAKSQELAGSPVTLMSEILKVLRGSEVHAETRMSFTNMMRVMLSNEAKGVGCITADFSLDMTYAEYVRFLDYVYNLPQATDIKSATLIQDVEAAGDAKRVYSFSLNLYIVKPMDILETKPNPFLETVR